MNHFIQNLIPDIMFRYTCRFSDGDIPRHAVPNYKCIDSQSRESCQDALTAMIGNVKSNTSSLKKCSVVL